MDAEDRCPEFTFTAAYFSGSCPECGGGHTVHSGNVGGHAVNCSRKPETIAQALWDQGITRGMIKLARKSAETFREAAAELEGREDDWIKKGDVKEMLGGFAESSDELTALLERDLEQRQKKASDGES